MHNRAYADHENDTISYQPLASEKAPAVYSEIQARVHRNMTPAQMRETGKTRRAAVHGKTVAFMRLSPTCKVTPVWDTFWHEEYPDEIEAGAAAFHWEEKRLEILKPGFLSRQP